MRLSPVSECALRTLMLLSVHRGRSVSLTEIARSYEMRPDRLVEVGSLLERLGIVEVEREGEEGLRLAVDPDEIRVGWLIRRTEPDLHLVECFDGAENTCPVTPACMLKHILHEAREDFLDSLDRFTLGDCLSSPARRRALVRLWTKAGEEEA